MRTLADRPIVSGSSESTRWGALAARSIRGAVLLAISIGAFVGALSCAAGLAAGEHHAAADVAIESTPVDLAIGHANHMDDATVHTDSAESPPRPTNAPSSVPEVSGHPETSCWAPIELQAGALDVAADVSIARSRGAQVPSDCVNAPEPPVPRFS